MYQIVHGTAGILIGSQTGNPVLAFVLGLVSHFLLDVIPHDLKEADQWRRKGNYTLRVGMEALVDLVLLLGLIIILWQVDKISLNASILAATAGSIIPDYIWGFTILTKTKNKILKAIEKFHNFWLHELILKSFHIRAKYAIPIQIITFLILLSFVI